MSEIDWSAEEPNMYRDGYQAAQRGEPREQKFNVPPGTDKLRVQAAWLAGYDAGVAERG
jgi:hypothetical protein